ncbi:hypothetical protein IWZ00DRAFT_178043 [Phyllosticta capitalensis]
MWTGNFGSARGHSVRGEAVTPRLLLILCSKLLSVRLGLVLFFMSTILSARQQPAYTPPTTTSCTLRFARNPTRTMPFHFTSPHPSTVALVPLPARVRACLLFSRFEFGFPFESHSSGAGLLNSLSPFLLFLLSSVRTSRRCSPLLCYSLPTLSTCCTLCPSHSQAKRPSSRCRAVGS